LRLRLPACLTTAQEPEDLQAQEERALGKQGTAWAIRSRALGTIIHPTDEFVRTSWTDVLVPQSSIQFVCSCKGQNPASNTFAAASCSPVINDDDYLHWGQNSAAT